MPQSFISRLIDFISTPYGVVGIAVMLLMVFQATRSRQIGWLLFSLLCFASSLSTFRSQYIRTPPALVFPLQQLRAVDRPLSIVLLISIVIVALTVTNTWRREILPKAAKYLIAVQGVIIFKIFLYGSNEFAFLTAATFGSIIFGIKQALGNWMSNDENFNLAARSIAHTGAIFVVLNAYQLIINRSAVIFIQSRFSGTTANPQQAALLLAATIPCVLLMIQTSDRSKSRKTWWIALLLATLYMLVLTGSRTGILMGLVSIMLFYRNNGGAWFRLGITLALIAAIVIPFLQPENLSSSATGIDTSVRDRFTTSSSGNTREGVWGGMWSNFTENPIFGVPLAGDRIGFGESSWLGVASELGLVGLIPMLLMGWECLMLMWQLYRLGERQSHYFYQSSTVIAGLGSMLIGSFFEAFLLGNLTISMFAFLTYLIMGAYVLEVDRFRTYHAKVEAELAARAGVYQ